MIKLSIRSAADILNASKDDLPDTDFTGVTIDSRKSCVNQMFVALKGDNFDGHRFVQAAYDNGAVVALVETRQNCSIPQIEVADCRVAMAKLANFWRHHCAPLVLSLTGSNGKTTVKEMLYQILANEAPTHATRGNLNNDIGVPLTLFELDSSHRFAIVEMGANHRGEIANLANIAEPEIVYVNNVAAAHLAGFGDVQGVKEAKGELYAYCRPEHKALFNADEVATDYWKGICAATTRLDCAVNQQADVTANWEATDSGLSVSFSHLQQQAFCELNVMGEHNARNALAAVSMAVLAGVSVERAAENLAGFSGVKGRLQLMVGPNHSRLIDDSYNANPNSLEAGIKVVCALEASLIISADDVWKDQLPAELG
ncbi:MAG: UDP-N-acetylmuramoyl-tripeptide--D-alanyl-D-alanine ligase, partial [Pseudomonadota bacterium]